MVAIKIAHQINKPTNVTVPALSTLLGEACTVIVRKTLGSTVIASYTVVGRSTPKYYVCVMYETDS
jgi:hypothetical protein